MRPAVPVLLIGLAFALSGCVTLSKYNALKERVESLESEQQLITERLVQDEQRLENLHSRMKEAQDETRRAGADRGATIEELRSVLVEANGKLEELAFHGEARRKQLVAIMEVLDAKLGTSIAVTPSAIPDDKDQLFAQGMQLFGQGAADKARSLHRIFLQRYPKDDRAAEAQFYIGESYMAEKKYDLAVKEFQAVHDHFSKSDFVAKSLWRISDALVALKDCKKARAVLAYLRDTQRKTPEGGKVPERLKELGTVCK